MYIVYVKATENSDWEFYCTADTFEDAREEMRNAVEIDGYEEATIKRR